MSEGVFVVFAVVFSCVSCIDVRFWVFRSKILKIFVQNSWGVLVEILG